MGKVAKSDWDSRQEARRKGDKRQEDYVNVITASKYVLPMVGSLTAKEQNDLSGSLSMFG